MLLYPLINTEFCEHRKYYVPLKFRGHPPLPNFISGYFPYLNNFSISDIVITMIMSVTMTSGGKVSGPQECAGCNKKIHDKFILKVSGKTWPSLCIILSFFSFNHVRLWISEKGQAKVEIIIPNPLLL